MPGCNIFQFVGLNDTLSYVSYEPKGTGPTYGVIMNTYNKSILYSYNAYPMGGSCYISPKKDYMIQMGYDNFFKLPIPYDKLTKTEEDIKTLNNGFTLAPNPTYEQVSFNIYLKNDQDLTYTITTLDGKTIKKEYLGKYAAGYASGTIRLNELTTGEYFITMYDGLIKIAGSKISVIK